MWIKVELSTKTKSNMIQEYLRHLTDAQISLIKARVQIGKINLLQRAKIRLAERIVKGLIDANAPEGALRRMVMYSPRREIILNRRA